MKKAILIFFAIVALLYSMKADCGASGQTIIIDSEVELQALEGCDSIFGNLSIEMPSLTFLTPLSDLKYIEGNFSLVGCTSLFDLDALSNLEYIGGDMIFQVIFTLQNVDGLSNLTYVGGDIIFEAVISIPDVDGLSGIQTVNGDLIFTENHTLTDIDGLSNLTTVTGDVFLGSLNNLLADISGLNNLHTIGGDFYLNLPSLTNLSVVNSLQNVGGDLTIESCDVLANITGLTSLSSVAGTMLIQDNPILVNTDGLDSLSLVGQDLTVINNPSYFSCCGLYNILTFGQVNGATVLEGNAPSCNSVANIQSDCTVGVTTYQTDIFVTKRMKNDGVELVFNSISEDKDVRVYSVLGQLVFEKLANSDQSIFVPLKQKSIYLIDIRQNGLRKVLRTNI